MESATDQVAKPVRRWLARSYGAYLIAGSIICGLLCGAALSLFTILIEKTPYPELTSVFVMWCVEHPILVSFTATPSLLLGISLFRVRKRSLPLVLLGTAGMMIPMGVTLYCFIMLLAPLYTIQPL